jgi:hypothetical protein
MKKLSHIKLYEAFESTKLSKILDYIKEDKSKFLETLKLICNKIDFPYSKLSDDYFEYLPFSKALKKADIITDDACEATSAQSYPEYSVDGEICHEGKVKRKWGKGLRVSKCEVCKGTGVKPKKEGDIKLIKFWFSKDGKFIYTSAVDGVIRNTAIIKSNLDNEEYESKTSWLDNRSFLSEIKNGDYALIKINNRDTLCYVYIQSDRPYAIQNRHEGSTPYGSDWMQMGKYSWFIGGGEFNGGKILNKVDKDVEKDEVDPFTWNVGVTFRYSSINLDKNVNLKTQLSDANFALVLDFAKLSESGYKKKADIQIQRAVAKRGSKLELGTDAEIKKENINRYIELMSKNLNISDNVSDVNKLVKRILGFKYALYITVSTEAKDDINTIMRRYYDFLKASEDSREYRLDDLNRVVNSSFKSAMNRMSNISDNLKHIRKETNESGLEIINKLDEISDIFYKKVSDFEIETIEDLEVIHQKVLSIRNLFSTDRYPDIRNRLAYFISYISRNTHDYSLRYLNDYSIYKDSIIKDLEKIKRVIERL